MDFITIGEMVIDFIPGQEEASYIRNAGGAPANVAIAAARNGLEAGIYCKVGDDDFGRFLLKTLRENNVTPLAPEMTKEAITTMAFVSLDENNDRSFTFARKPGADMMLTKEEVDPELIKKARIFHFGTLSSTHAGVREATRYAIDVAKENGLLVSFDPNLREPLWESLDQAKEEILYGMSKCDILKISDNEMEFMTGISDYTKGVEMLREQFDIPLICVTLGKEGSRAYYRDTIVEAAPFVREDTIETTGAGDTFEACTLNYILEHGLEDLTEENLKEMLTFANAGASIITTRKGALKVMPEKAEIEKVIRER